MTTGVVAGIVAHATRFDQANRLADAVGADLWSIDDGTLGCAANHLEVLGRLAKYDADWCLVLEDDAVVGGDFMAHVRHALAFAPAPIVGLYLGTGNPSGQPQRQIRSAVVTAQGLDRAWIIGDCLIGSVGYVIRGTLVPDMLDCIAGQGQEFPLRISRWAQDWDLRVGYTVPSLVDHADGEPIGHPAGRPRSTRRAWAYGTRENWDTPAVPLGFCNDWSKEQEGW